jgi:hypothetical protein
MIDCDVSNKSGAGVVVCEAREAQIFKCRISNCLKALVYVAVKELGRSFVRLSECSLRHGRKSSSVIVQTRPSACDLKVQMDKNVIENPGVGIMVRSSVNDAENPVELCDHGFGFLFSLLVVLVVTVGLYGLSCVPFLPFFTTVWFLSHVWVGLLCEVVRYFIWHEISVPFWGGLCIIARICHNLFAYFNIFAPIESLSVIGQL